MSVNEAHVGAKGPWFGMGFEGLQGPWGELLLIDQSRVVLATSYSDASQWQKKTGDQFVGLEPSFHLKVFPISTRDNNFPDHP